MNKNLRESLAIARALSCTIEQIPATGEIRIKHPRVAHCVRVNGRRKDTPRCLQSFLNRIQQALTAAVLVLSLVVPTGGLQAQVAGQVAAAGKQLSGDDLIEKTIGQISPESVNKFPDFEEYFRAAHSNAKGKGLEAVVADLDNHRLQAVGDSRRVVVLAAEGLPHEPADLHVVDSRTGTVLERIQAKFGPDGVLTALDDPKYSGMKILTTEDSLKSLKLDLLKAKTTAARRGTALDFRWSRLEEALESGRVMSSTCSGAPLPEAEHVIQTVKRVLRRQWDHMLNLRSTAQATKSLTQKLASTGSETAEAAGEAAGRVSRIAGKLAKAAPVAGVAIEVTVNGKQVYDTEAAYRRGELTNEQRTDRHLQTGAKAVGGAAGAWAGGKAGAVAGAAAGAIAGPIGAAAGGAVGAVGGAVAGAFGGEWIATSALHVIRAWW